MNQNYQNILSILTKLRIDFQEIDHEESHSCDDSKALRLRAGMDGIGSKNIVFHSKGNFYLVTTEGDRDIKARNFKHEFMSKDIRFASQDEIARLIQAAIGSIPPFGFTNSLLPIYVDAHIFEHSHFCFNPGTPIKSIRIQTEDLRKVYAALENRVKFFRQSEEGFEIVEDIRR